MKKVSVIIPCYNCEAYVGDTLESLEKQTYSDFGVICVNDGSADGTLALLRSWEKRGSLQLTVIDQSNGGVSRARNAGIDAAEGEYLLFLDADDLYHPCFIESLVSAAEACKAETAYCRLSRNRAAVMDAAPDGAFVIHSQREAMHNLLYRMGEFGFYCYLYNRKIMEQQQLRFDENTRHFEDREFNWKYLCHCNSAAFVDSPLYYYRVTPTSATQSRTVNWRTDRLDAAKRIVKYMEQTQAVYTEEVKDYLWPRVVWTTAKNYALGGRMDLLLRLGEEYDVKPCMKRMTRDGNKLVALSSLCWLISPRLYYFVVRLKK